MTRLSEERLTKWLADSNSKYATPAPWAVHSEPEVGMPPTIMQAKPIGEGFLDDIEPLHSVDKHLAVTARNALPELIAEVLRLREELHRQNQAHSKAIKDIQEYAGLTDLDIQVATDGMP